MSVQTSQCMKNLIACGVKAAWVVPLQKKANPVVNFDFIPRLLRQGYIARGCIGVIQVYWLLKKYPTHLCADIRILMRYVAGWRQLLPILRHSSKGFKRVGATKTLERVRGAALGHSYLPGTLAHQVAFLSSSAS